MPTVGIVHDQVATRSVPGRVDIDDVKVEHALPVVVREGEPVSEVVRVDTDTEPGPLVEVDRLSEVHDWQCRCRDNPKSPGQPLDAIATELDVVPRPERSGSHRGP